MARSLEAGVLLAGGASSRMGRPKALLRDESGRTYLERLAVTLRNGGCGAVLVVGGCHVAEIARELPEGVLLVRNPRWQDGQLSSAQAGLRAALDLRAANVVLHLVDQPLVTAHDVRKVRTALQRADLAVATHGGRTGHPIALSWVAAELVTRSRASNLRLALEVVRRRVLVPRCSKGCVRGANTPAEARELFRGR